jgi:hypothetical protein
MYHDYRELLDPKDIDGVIVATPDHGRVRCGKPVDTVRRQGRTFVQAVSKDNRVFQVGSQQRSMAMNRLACGFVKRKK